jgi:GntR family transcriptional regulator, transcriptional repressor for pyruvate dehydrogenase complex
MIRSGQSPNKSFMNVQVRPVESRRLYQQIADQIRELIQAGAFEVGGRLPAERELAQQLGVSRPSVREALIALDVEGNVEIRSGSGVYVCNQPQPAARKSVPVLGESPRELMQARAAFESAVVVIACSQATAEQVARLREIVRKMGTENARSRPPVDLDRQFHMTVAEMTGNSVMVRLIAELFDERHSPIFAKLRSRYDNTRTWRAAVKEHVAIVRAIEARDPLGAQAAMLTHLRASETRWVGG